MFIFFSPQMLISRETFDLEATVVDCYKIGKQARLLMERLHMFKNLVCLDVSGPRKKGDIAFLATCLPCCVKLAQLILYDTQTSRDEVVMLANVLPAMQ